MTAMEKVLVGVLLVAAMSWWAFAQVRAAHSWAKSHIKDGE